MAEAELGKSAESPLSVRSASRVLGEYINRLGRIWVEGELISPKQYGRTWYATLRDPEADVSFTIVIDDSVMSASPSPITDGTRVVANVGIEWWNKKGEVKLRAHALSPVGMGDLMLRIEQLRRQLAAEGLFDESRKRQLPFLPRRIGLITGRDTDAKADILRKTRERWPAAAFSVKEIPLMQKDTPLLAIAAMHELEAEAEVDVIVIARGGGSFEDLLPWSDEGLCRAVAKALKPVVSAIGHENDRPVLDDAADVRARTPTDAATKIVPDLQEELARTNRAAGRLRDHRANWLRNQLRHLELAVGVLRASSPKSLIELQIARLSEARQRLSLGAQRQLQRRQDWLGRRRASLAALSPYAVLSRGYALATSEDGSVIRQPADVAVGARFNLQLQSGAIRATRSEDQE